MNIQILVFVVYIVALFAISIVVSKRIKDYQDFFVAGRNLGLFVLIGSFLASGIGGNIFFNVHGLMAKFGALTFILLMSFGLSFVVLGFLAPKVRRLRKITLAEMLGQIFDGKVRTLAVVILLITLVAGLSIQFRAAGAVIATVLNIPFAWAFLIASAVVIIYTLLGGLWSDTVSDVFQAAVIIIGILVMIPFLLPVLGGLPQAVTQVGALNNGDFFNILVHGWPFLIGGVLVAMLFGLVDADRFQRIFGSRDERVVKRSLIWTGAIYMVFIFMALSIAAFGLVLFPDIVKSEDLWPVMIESLLPAGLGAVVLSSLMAVVMSTSDSMLLAASSIVVKDILKRQQPDEDTSAETLSLSRWILLGIGVLTVAAGFLLADIFETFVFMNLLIVSTLLAPVLFGLLWRRTTSNAAFWSGVVGGIAMLGLHFFTSFSDEKALVPSVVISVVVLLVITFSSKRSSTSLPANQLK